MKKEIKYYVVILVFVCAFLVFSFFWELDPLAKRITTVTALISAVAFWLQFKRTERLNESNFIMNLNNQFIGNKDMSHVEHELELYYNQYQVLFSRGGTVSETDVSRIYLGISQSRTSEDCQKLINYLVYLESLAALVNNGVIHIKVIDDLFSYRFFLAVNNPVVQEGELLPYADFYKGIYGLSEKWINDHHERNIPIPMEQFALTQNRLEEWRRLKPEIVLDISLAQGNDKKDEIAKCLYGTDIYIYPEAFGEDSNIASKVIRKLIGVDGSLLDYKNLLVARYNGQVCGVCLVSDGTGAWNTEDIIKKYRGLIPSEEGFRYASENYFSKFTEKIPENTVELVACCVDDGFRRKRVASRMLDVLMDMYKGKDLVLTVLETNQEAINLYCKKGFEPVETGIKGFAPEGLPQPICMVMKRKAE